MLYVKIVLNAANALAIWKLTFDFWILICTLKIGMVRTFPSYMPLLPQSIKEYIDKCKAQNLHTEDIIKQLAAQGWSNDVLTEAKEYCESNGLHSNVPTPNNTPSVIPIPPGEVYVPTPIAKSFLRISTQIKIGSGVLVAIILLFGASVLAAYGMVPIGQGSAQQAFSNFVVGLPFMPKTKQYVIYKSLQEHKKVTTFTLDASLALSSSDITELLGTGNFEMDMKGPVDYTDSKNPSAALHAQITNAFSADVVSKDQKFYFKIDTIPSLVSAFLTELGFSPTLQHQLVDKWFYQDNTPLNTEAAKNLQNQQPSETPEEVEKKFIAALNTSSIENSITMDSTTLDSFGTYHIHFAPSDAVLDQFSMQLSPKSTDNLDTSGALQPSHYIHTFILDAWIDQQQYFARKIAISFTYKTPSTTNTLNNSTALQNLVPLHSQSIPVSFVIHLSDVGKPVQINAPAGAVKFDDFFKTLIESTATQSGGLASYQYAQANNTKRQVDINAILNAVDQYAADHNGKLPFVSSSIAQPISSTSINICNSLVPAYIAALPEDPSINSGKLITNCNTSYNTGYTVQSNAATDRVTVAAPHAENQLVISVTR